MKNKRKFSVKDIIIDQLILSKRKSLCISVNYEAKVIVKAPIGTPLNYIRHFIIKKADWIKDRKKYFQSINILNRNRFSYNEQFMYLGEKYPLKYTNNSEIPFYFNGDSFVLSLDYIEQVEKLFINWYKTEAYNHFHKRLNYYSKMSGLIYNSFRLSNAKKRWGSCSSDKKINLNWKLIMTPDYVIDYVIVHELVHTCELNHSKKFWTYVNSIFPDFPNSIKWLRQNEHFIGL